jgi:hypothetical protein
VPILSPVAAAPVQPVAVPDPSVSSSSPAAAPQIAAQPLAPAAAPAQVEGTAAPPPLEDVPLIGGDLLQSPAPQPTPVATFAPTRTPAVAALPALVRLQQPRCPLLGTDAFPCVADLCMIFHDGALLLSCAAFLEGFLCIEGPLRMAQPAPSFLWRKLSDCCLSTSVLHRFSVQHPLQAQMQGLRRLVWP